MVRKMVPVLYTDIDGTIRYGKDELGHFVNGPADVKVFDGVPELLQAYKAKGWRIVGVSNQGGIALGFQDALICAQAMEETQKQCLGQFDEISFCPHHPDAQEPEMASCWCRKPYPGLVIEGAMILADHYGHAEFYPPFIGLFVGDRPEDEQCARNANLPFMSAVHWRQGDHLKLI